MKTDLNAKEIKDEICKKYGYDYIYDDGKNYFTGDCDYGEENYAYMIEIFSYLVDHDSDKDYISNYGVNRQYLERCLHEINIMEGNKAEIEMNYGDRVKCYLSDWNEGCQYGCVLYIYIFSNDTEVDDAIDEALDNICKKYGIHFVRKDLVWDR